MQAVHLVIGTGLENSGKGAEVDGNLETACLYLFKFGSSSGLRETEKSERESQAGSPAARIYRGFL